MHTELPAELVLAWMDRDPHPRVVVSKALRILWSNRAAKAEFARHRDLEDRNELLTATAADQQADLLAFAARCDETPRSLSLACSGSKAHMILCGQEIPRPRGGSYIGLRFHRSDSGPGGGYADLGAIFQLTKAESRVLLRMLDGETAMQVSRTLGISVETTRSHVRKIYAKLNVSSREGMFSRIAYYRR